MIAFFSDHYELPLPPEHTFPMVKYRLLRDRVTAAGLADLRDPLAATDEQLLRAHNSDYVSRMSDGTVTAAEMKLVGFPWSAFLVERSRRSSGATLEAGRAAAADGVAVNLAGGTHHAFRDRGEGYCLFNDTVVAARQWQAEQIARRVVVIDLDVHQGNGTASICRGDPTIYTFSVHGAKNYPWRKETSDLDIELPDRCPDADYLAAVDAGLTRAIADADPDFAVYLAGADPFENDRLGRLGVSKAGLAERDKLVFDAVRRRGIPVVVTMAGGYAKDVSDTVDIHVATITLAAGVSK